MDKKRKVGRPKLVDGNQKRRALLYLIIPIVLLIIISLVFMLSNKSILGIKKSATNLENLRANAENEEEEDDASVGGDEETENDDDTDPESEDSGAEGDDGESEGENDGEDDDYSSYSEEENRNNCPVAPSIKGVTEKNHYSTSKVEISINASNLTSAQLKKVYVIERPYDEKRSVTYYINGKKKKENIGKLKDGKKVALTKAFSKAGTKYSKTIDIGNMYYLAVYAGDKRCYYNYFVKNGVTIVSGARKYKFSNYNILTKKGVVRGVISGAKVTSSNEKVLKLNGNIKKFSYKATGQNVYVGKEGKDKVKTAITIKNTNMSGKFYLALPSRYFVTGYLLNPLTKTNSSIGRVDKLTKVSHTKSSKGKKVYGVELKTSAKKNVYAMDTGTVMKVRNKGNGKDTYGKLVQIKSSIRNNKYFHTYANLSSINVKKGDRVYKGQVIGKTSKSYLFVSFTQQKKNKKKKQPYNAVLLNNLIGRKIFYARINNRSYKTFRKWIGDEKLCLYQFDESICENN